MKKMDFDTIGGRRFLLTLGSGTVASLLQWFGKLDAAGSTYAMIVLGTVGVYIGGNVMERKHAAMYPADKTVKHEDQ